MTLVRRRAAASALALALTQGLPLARAQVPPDEDLLPPDRLDRHAEQNEPAGSDLWVAAAGQARIGTTGHAFGAGVVIGASLDGFAAPQIEGTPPAEGSSTPTEPPVRIDARLARGAVAAALHRARVVEADERLGSLAPRSRSSAALPELRLRAMRVIDEDEALSPTEYDPSRVTAKGGSSTWMEARATWKLDRLVFAREEIAVERLRIGQARIRRAIEHDVLDGLARWHRARWRALDPEAPGDRRIEAELESATIEAMLDVWTDGWFSRELARRSGRP
jgi:hypothetical protein